MIPNPVSHNTQNIMPVLQNEYGTIYMLIPPSQTGFFQNVYETIPNDNQLHPNISSNMPIEPAATQNGATNSFMSITDGIASKKNTPTKTQLIKANTIEGYKNPFAYKHLNCNIEKTFARNRSKELNDGPNIDWNCYLCDKVFQTKKILLDHYEMHKSITDQLGDNSSTTSDKFVCPVCGLTYKTLIVYKRHINKHRKKEHFCDICQQPYVDEYNLSVHYAKHTSDPKNLVCYVCKRFSTTDPSQLATHIETEHIKELFFCEECDRSFSSKTWFNDHKIFHFKSDKKINCDQCSQSFSSPRSYQYHTKLFHRMKTNKIVKYCCVECDLTFPAQNNLDAHHHNFHGNSNSFLCTVCAKGFRFLAPLTQHMKIHGEGQYICSTCGKKFKQKKLLTMHVRIHTGEKPNKCKECGKCFTQKATLNVHLRTHSGERPYPCQKCEKGFITKTIRDTHQKSCKKLL